MKQEIKLLDKIGIFIKSCRKRQGMSRETLYEITGISARTIMRIENGNTNVKLNDLLLIAEAVGVSLIEVVVGANGNWNEPYEDKKKK